MSSEPSFIIPFLEEVISDIKTGKLTSKQILECSRFYINYTTDKSLNKVSYTELDCVAAGITFYKTLCSSLQLEEQNEK